MRYSIALAAVLTAGLMAASPVRAADITSPMAPELKQTEKDGWTFAIAPYFWAAGMSGDAGLFGLPTVHLDMDFGDILDESRLCRDGDRRGALRSLQHVCRHHVHQDLERSRHAKRHHCRQRRCHIRNICRPHRCRLFGAAK